MRKLFTLTALAALALAGCESAADTSDVTAAELEASKASGATAPEPATAATGDADKPAGDDGRRGRGFAGRLEAFDKDGDGKLDEAERAAMRAERSAAMFSRIDTDGDGAISEAEVSAAGRRASRMLGDFAAVDADSDGTISPTELEAAMAKRRGMGRRGKRGKRGAPPAGG